MPLPVRDGAHTPHVVAATDHDRVARLKFHEIQNLASGQIQSHCVVGLDLWVRVADGATIVGDAIWDALGPPLNLLDTAQLVAGLLLDDFVQHESALGIVEQPEVLLGLLDLHHIHEARWVEHVAANLAVNLDQPLHHDHLHLTVGQGILESLAKHDNQGHALAQLVRTGRRLGSPTALQLVEHPVLGGEHALQVLDDTARHGC
mmetsp:Transcript_59845/g.96879  ORF Transcript_59845/g.96879 Transcript_59845/m.96879 type:complete len:204 (-) Transcript_59845:72-683(-)